MSVGLTPYITPAMLLSTNYGMSWSTFPRQGAPYADQIAAQLDICAALTSDMDTLADQALRATVDVEQEFGPDFIISIQPNGWSRFRLSHGPILQLLGARVSAASAVPADWNDVPVTALVTENNTLPATGTIVPSGTGPTAALIAPGYVDWSAGRKGFYVEITAVNGFPLAGIDVAAAAGATEMHVDDITGWWNGVGGARGTIYDPPRREYVTATGFMADVSGAVSGPGTLALSGPLQFDHNPTIGEPDQPDQTILVSAMPAALIQAGFYLATYYGLIRGATGAVMQVGRGSSTGGGARGVQSWYDAAEKTIAKYARVF